MKNFSGSFSKLFLVSLLAGAMMLAGCGENNPSSSSTDTTDASTTQQATDATVSTYDIIGKVSSTTGQFDTKSNITINLTNIATKDTYKNVCDGQAFAFQKVNAGYYKVEAVDNNNIYNTETIYKKIDSNIDDLSLTLTTKATESENQVFVTLTGNLVDETGNGIPFASIVAVNTKTSQEIQTSTDFKSGKYTFKDIPAGTYKITYSKDSFNDGSADLIITDVDAITFDSKKVTNNTLTNITLTYKPMATGSIAGVLTGYSAGNKCLLYKTSSSSATTLPGIILTFTPQDNGYFFIKNLQQGWYCVAKDGCAAPTASYDNNGNLIGYQFAEGDTYFYWLEVVNDTTSLVPSAEQ